MRRTIFAGIAVTGLLLTACGGDDDAADEGAAPEETSSTVAESTTEPEATEDDVETTTTEAGTDGGSDPGAELTPDGTTLAYGEAAVVAYEAPEGAIELAVTVTEVEQSSFDDLAAAGLEVDDTDGLVPYFIRYSAELLSDVDVSGVGVNTELDALGEDGQEGGTLIAIGLDACSSESFSADSAVGDTVESCKVALLPESATLAGAFWDEDLDEGITWAA